MAQVLLNAQALGGALVPLVVATLVCMVCGTQTIFAYQMEESAKRHCAECALQMGLTAAESLSGRANFMYPQ